MKKFILAVAVAATMVAGQAQAGGYHGGHHGGGHWVGPAVGAAVLGAVIYGATRPPVYVQQPQVIYAPQPQVIYQQQEYRQPPVYSQQYPAPNYPSCTPLYDVNQQYRGCF